MQIIQRLTVVNNPTRIFEVGTEIDGREVIEIKQVGSEDFSEFWVVDEDENLISSIENAPVIVDYKEIAEHDHCVVCQEISGLMKLNDRDSICENCAQNMNDLSNEK